MYALDAGPLDELEKKYGDVKKAAGFVYSERFGHPQPSNPNRGIKTCLIHKKDLFNR